MAVDVADVAILGGGIAGLWALDRLRHAGYAAVLLERGQLGGGQTLASQGIIHSGLKYNIPGFEDQALPFLADMPQRWRDSFSGTDGPDLRLARIAAPRFLIHVRAGVLSRVKAGFARASMRSGTAELAPADWPSPLRGADGAVFAIDEFVVDVPSVLRTLSSQHADAIRQLPADNEPAFRDGVLRAGSYQLRCRHCVFAAGAGNEALLRHAGIADVPTQRRPLHQVMIGGMGNPVFAHCIGAQVKPLATVTSHRLDQGGYVWYVGGGIAESGVGQSPAAVIDEARAALPQYFPGADFSNAVWRTLPVDRAEFAGEGEGRPGDAVALLRDDVLVAWPTKLALAPHLADKIVAAVSNRFAPGVPASLENFSALAPPALAPTPWEDAATWN